MTQKAYLLLLITIMRQHFIADTTIPNENAVIRTTA